MSKQGKKEISDIAIQTANSIMAFVLNPPSSKYQDEVRDSIAKSIDFACKKSKVGMIQCNKVVNAADDMLNTLLELQKYYQRNNEKGTPVISPHFENLIAQSIKKATI